MKLIGEVLAELFGMFVSDWPLTVLVLALVVAAILVLKLAAVSALLVGAGLLLGAVAILAFAVLSTDRT
ncbi:MAG TPA: hypothetical protein VIC25_02050 [Caulobacteraceae bacterium]|jgi:uncharacterized membrane protein YgaE (UPF0421/DUF939 family)